MPSLTVQNGKLLLSNGRLGTGQSCCCCCACSSAQPPFISNECALQSVVLTFDFSEFGVCTGTPEVTIVEADNDLGFAWSKRQSVTTSGGNVIIEANLWCTLDECLELRFYIIPETCGFCPDPVSGGLGGAFANGSILPSGVYADDDAPCCPVGGSVSYGPNIPGCGNTAAEFSVTATYVY